MFPTPIQNYSLKVNIGYRLLLIFTLLVWLLPLIAVMLTSMRTFEDVLAGNYWTFPEETALISNYTAVFEGGKMGRFFLNSLIITLPTVVGTLFLSSLAAIRVIFFSFFPRFIAPGSIPPWPASKVIINSDVEIATGCTIDRGSIDDTVIRYLINNFTIEEGVRLIKQILDCIILYSIILYYIILYYITL